jgi:hypothetical protein
MVDKFELKMIQQLDNNWLPYPLSDLIYGKRYELLRKFIKDNQELKVEFINWNGGILDPHAIQSLSEIISDAIQNEIKSCQLQYMNLSLCNIIHFNLSNEYFSLITRYYEMKIIDDEELFGDLIDRLMEYFGEVIMNVLDESLEDAQDELSEDAQDESLEDALDESLEDAQDELSEDALDELSEDVLDELSEDALDESSEDAQDESLEDALDELSEDVLDELSEDVLNESSEDTMDESHEAIFSNENSTDDVIQINLFERHLIFILNLFFDDPNLNRKFGSMVIKLITIASDSEYCLKPLIRYIYSKFGPEINLPNIIKVIS